MGFLIRDHAHLSCLTTANMFRKSFDKLRKAAAQSIDEAMAAKMRRDEKAYLAALRKALALEREAADMAPDEGTRAELNLSSTVLAFNCAEFDLATELATAALVGAPEWVRRNVRVLRALIDSSRKAAALKVRSSTGASYGMATAPNYRR